MFGKIKNIVKTLGLSAALALAIGAASLPSAALASDLAPGAPGAPVAPIASTASTSSDVPPAGIAQVAQVGKLAIYVSSMSASPINPPAATIIISDEAGQVVAKGQTSASNNMAAFELTEGVYKVRVTAKGYAPAGQVFKIAAGYATELNIVLQPR